MESGLGSSPVHGEREEVVSFWDIMADDEAFDNLLCLVIIGGIVLALVIRSFRGDGDL